MSKIKKITLVLIFVCSLFCGLYSFIPSNKVLADNEDAVLTVQKVTYDKSLLEEYGVNKIGELPTSSQENLKTLNNAINSVINANDSIIENIQNNDVVSINKNSTTNFNEAVIVKLEASSNNTIQILNPNLTINGVNVSLLPYQTTNGYAFIGAYDFSLVDTIIENFDYSKGGYFNFDFSYNAQTQQNINFDFYMIDENEFFANNNFPVLNNVEQENSSKDKNINFFYYGNSVNKPVLKFNPYKFAPTIKFAYNETLVTLTTTLNNNKVVLNSSNEKIFASKTLDIISNFSYITLDVLGKYEINFDLMFTNIYDNTYTRLSGEQIDNIESLKTYGLYNIGYEAYYKDYSNVVNPSLAEYKKFYNDNFISDFTYLFDAENLTSSLIEESLNSLDNNKKIDLNKVSSTNQAPVKLIGYVSENLTGAKYYKIEVVNGQYKLTNETSFVLSNRFEDSGLYCVILPYKFETFKNSTLNKVIIFRIENSKPEVSFKNLKDNLTNISSLEDLIDINKNNFTNKDTYVLWNNKDASPFSINSKIKISLNNTVLNLDDKIIKIEDKNCVKLTENGEYLVQITYGIYSNTVEKVFVIDNEEIDFKIISCEKNNEEYALSNELTLTDNKVTTSSNFAVFTKNKSVKSNKISVKYDYIAFEKDNLTDSELLNLLNNEVYIYNNYKLSGYYNNLTYNNTKINNLESFDSLKNENLKNNSNAVININALYYFTITDYAGNTKNFYVLLDSTSPVVLQTSSLVDFNKSELETDNEFNERIANIKNNLSIKLNSSSENEKIISNNYCLIFGNYKTLKFVVNSNNLEFAKKYFNDDALTVKQNVKDNEISINFPINSNNITYSVKAIDTQNSVKVENFDETYNLFTIDISKLNGEEIEYNYTLKSLINNIENTYSFVLNTDKNKIYIYNNSSAKIDGDNYRIQKNSVTNSKEVYITYVDDSLDNNYKLKNLTLSYYAFSKNSDDKTIITNNSIQFVSNAITFDLLSLRKSYNDGYITDLINPTYVNGKYVTKEGRYVITKEYENGETKSQTFYVDRTSPLVYLELLDTVFNLDKTPLTLEEIKYYINNNQSLITNKINLENFIYNIDIKYDDNVKYELNYKISKGGEQIYRSNSNDIFTFSKTGTYVISIFDNSSNKETNTNKIEFTIELKNDLPSGYFVVDSDKKIIDETSTKSNSLKFVFEDDISNFMYNIDVANISLSLNNDKIYYTTTENTGKALSFNSRIFYNYNNAYGDIFKLTREELSSNKLFNNEKRYRYTLLILDPTKITSNLYENGISKEGMFSLEVSYGTSNTLILNKEVYNNNTYSILIDHTAPVKNITKLIENDMFLNETEKETLLNSVINKDKSTELNFENYAFIITEAPQNFGVTDTKDIYIRKYNKYLDSTVENKQSLVIGDKDFNDSSITRYRFDANALTSNNDKLYTPGKAYTVTDINDLFNETGYYEIIEIDEAENYTIYTVLYLKNYNFSLNYSYENNGTKNETLESVSSNVLDYVNGANFKLNSFTLSNDYDYLDVIITIENSSNNNTTEHLRYFPSEISDESIIYFNDLTKLINYINSKMTNVENHIGTTINISNRKGLQINIKNNIPTEEINFDNTIIDYENNFVVTIPDEVNNTSVVSFKVYPVINGEKSTTPLTKDSNKTLIDINVNKTYVFSKLNEDIKDENGKVIEISIYYLEWIDNFGRMYNKVKVVGTTDFKYFDFSKAQGNVVTKDGEIYTKDKDNIVLRYQPSLYSINAYYMLLPNTNKNPITIADKTLTELNLFSLASRNQTSYDNSVVKFVVELTDLTTFLNSEQTTYTLTYTYYPTMPIIDFTDSSSNSLEILPNNFSSIINTSKNVALSYMNNTLFTININAERKYTDSFGVEKTEYYNNINKEYIFTELGEYTITVVNELGNENIYKFVITTATNKTYQVVTNESNMKNFEILPSGDIVTINNIDFEVYYSIYNTKIETNSDFNLQSQELTNVEGFTNTIFDKLWVVNKVVPNSSQEPTPYKYIAVKKIAYNSNFLNVGGDDTTLSISYSSIGSDVNLAQNLNGYTITFSQGVIVEVPLYNYILDGNIGSIGGNKIKMSLYYNNRLITLNSNIYKTTEDLRQQLDLSRVPAGVYSLYFEDIAGNTQLFAGNSFLNIVILNEIAIKMNGNFPVDYAYFNSDVNLQILEQQQYNTNSIGITVNRNGEAYKNFTRNSNGDYIFCEYGFYTVNITANINTSAEPITKTIHFTILNSQIAYKEFSFISLNGQNISKVLKNGIDVTNELKKFFDVGNDSSISADAYKNAYLYNLNLSSTMKYEYYQLDDEGNYVLDDNGNKIVLVDYYNGNGVYEIFVETQNSILDKQVYSFKVWIRDENVSLKINSTVKEGESTTKEIKFSYNAYLIYSQIGECSIYINDQLAVSINANSENKISEFTIPRSQKGTFIVQIKSDNNTELSYVVYKKEPLSTTSIIVIVIASVLVALVVFMFIKLRRKIKIK